MKQLNNPVPTPDEMEEILIGRYVSMKADERFKAVSSAYWVLPITDWRVVMSAVQAWEYSVSYYKPSKVVFAQFPTYYEDGNAMARKAATTKRIQESKKAEWQGFINVRLSEEDKTRIEALCKKPKLEDVVSTLCDWGKFSVSYTNNAYNCTSVISEGDFAGYGVSSYAPTPIMAMVITAYKMAVYHETFGKIIDESSTRPDFG